MEDLVLESSRVMEGFKFMVLGMGTVFSFLTLMIGTMNLQSYIIRKFFPEPVAAPESSSRKTGKTGNTAKVAAITAAVMHHKNAKS